MDQGADDHTDWDITAALPNISLKEPIFSKNAAVLPQDHAIIETKVLEKPKSRGFINGFCDPFGVQLQPAFIVTNKNIKKEKRTIELLSSFRDILSLGIIPYERARTVNHNRSGLIQWADAFDIYPWQLSNDGEHLISLTPAQTALHDPNEFKGQSRPELPAPYTPANTIHYHNVLRRMFCLWEQYYISEKDTIYLRRLFRALNVANQALRLPGGRDITVYDVGRILSLWVSAFEILAHPGEHPIGNRKKKVDRSAVLHFIERINWKSESLTTRNWEVPVSDRKTSEGTLPQYIYGWAFETRNRFLHGEPLKFEDMLHNPTQKHIFPYISMVFKAALDKYLNLSAFSKRNIKNQESWEWVFGYSGANREIENGIINITLRKGDED